MAGGLSILYVVRRFSLLLVSYDRFLLFLLCVRISWLIYAFFSPWTSTGMDDGPKAATRVIQNHHSSLAPTIRLLPFTISHSRDTVVVGNWPGRGSSSPYVGKGSVHNRPSLAFVCLGR